METRRFVAAVILVLLITGKVLVGGGIGGSAPFETDRLSVLVVEESRGNSTPAWVNGTSATSVRTWVANQGGEFLLLDQEDDTSKLDKRWQDAMKVERKTIPWIVASNGRRGFSEPVTTQEQAMKQLSPLGSK